MATLAQTIAQEVAAHLPVLRCGHPFSGPTHWLTLPGVPFPVGVQKWDRVRPEDPGFCYLGVGISPTQSEGAEFVESVKEALARKTGKLATHRKEGRRTVLLIDSDQVGPEEIGEALAKHRSLALACGMDEIYGCFTGERRPGGAKSFLCPVLHDGRAYPDLQEYRYAWLKQKDLGRRPVRP